jgi:hypothetical protein
MTRTAPHPAVEAIVEDDFGRTGALGRDRQAAGR